jgi:hypothetical protein
MGVVDLRTALSAFDELERLGFIEMTADAHFAVKAGDGSRARCWRLTWLAVPSKSKPATHDYQTAQPTDKRGRKRMARGRKALDTFTRKQMPVVESATRSGPSVWKNATTIGNTAPEGATVVRESATLEVETPLVSVDRRCSGIHHTYSLPAIEAADREFEGWKQAENPGGVSNDGIDDEALRHLRHRLTTHLAKASPGTQSRLAQAAGIPGGTLSKFIGGRGLSAHHFVNLQLQLRRCGAIDRVAA